jgi:phosphohistidine phosphatase
MQRLYHYRQNRSMNLILWRHAEAEDVAASLRIQRSTDLQRELTKRGEKQA